MAADPLGSDIPDVIQSAIQAGLLKAMFEQPLNGKRAFTMLPTGEDVRARKGNTLTLTRRSGLAPKTAPISQSAKNGDLNNGLTADQFTVEQYSLTMNEYMATADLNLMDDEVVIANQLKEILTAQGEQALSTQELLIRNKIYDRYLAGRTRVLGSVTTTSCQVDDARGFDEKLKAGKLTAVSGTNTLSVKETAVGGSGVNQTLTVTGVAFDGTNVSSAASVGGRSGVITFSTATAPHAGDVIEAYNAPDIVRAGGALSTHLLTSQDLFTTGMAMDMQVILDNNGTPRFANDEFLCLVTPTSHRQMFADPAFEKAYQTQYNSAPHSKGVITSFQGVTYVRTNFAIRQPKGNGVLVDVERPVMVGRDAVIRGDFEGLADFVRRKANSRVHYIELIGNVIYIVRDALDKAGQNVSMTWDTVIDWECPSDDGTTNLIVPSASQALRKRIVIGEHAAA